MNSENQFWITLWGIAAACFIVLVVCITGYNMHVNKLVAEAKDPVATACATGPAHSASPACLSLFAAKVQH